MPHRIEVVEDLVEIRFWGRISAEEMRSYMAELSEIEATMNPVLDRITDISETTGIDLNFDAMGELGSGRVAIAFGNGFKSAFCAPGPLQFGIWRMFEALNQNPKIQIQVLKTKESAIEWLKRK